MTLPLDFWALDIETDNSEGYGLDPTHAQIISIALVSHAGAVWFQAARDFGQEGELLSSFGQFLIDNTVGDLIVTWNGGAFDWPFLTTRMARHWIMPPWELTDHPTRQPKYEPLRGFDGVQSVETKFGAKHLDMAYVLDKKWAEDHNVSWSLKPVAECLGFRDHRLDMMRGETAHAEDPHMLAAYNIHDALITLRLALWAASFEDITAISKDLAGHLDGA